MTDTTLAYGFSYEKMRVSLRYWLIGKGYFKALKAMEFAAAYHTGLRKDGTPEFSHQIWQAQYLRTIAHGLLFPEETFCTIFLHDTPEDYPVPISLLTERFGTSVSGPVDRMSKVILGVKKSSTVYFEELADCPVASVAKGIDRVHNHGSMLGAFTDTKMVSYMEETDADILPMLKKARRRFPEQEAIYENIRLHLAGQMMFLRAYIERAAPQP
jgi:(p)ppGpp synthase/HD superfamily hydrolase